MGKWLLSGLIAGMAIACLPATAGAAPPANDAFADATPLVPGGEASSSNVAATSEVGEPNPKGFAAATGCATISTLPTCGTSVWYSFQTATGGEYTIETCDGGTDLVGILAIYEGTSVAALTPRAEGTPSPSCPIFGGTGIGSGSQLTFEATAGTTYHVELTGYGASEGSFYLRSYPGHGQPRPQPDTQIRSDDSFSNGRNTSFSAPGVVSGPRHSASFSFTSNGPASGFECSMDGASFAACTSPASYDGMAAGTAHAFRVRASLGGMVDPTPALERFTIDATPPDTTITSGPTGSTASQTAAWTAVGTERFNRGFIMCGIDAMPLHSCGGPASTTFSSLCQGPHAFRAAGIDNAANVDPSPAIARIDVTAGPACGAPTVGASTNVAPGATFVNLIFPFDDVGAGGYLHLEYGPTAAYGLEVPNEPIAPQMGGSEKLGIGRLAPSTPYHYRVTIVTPFGTASTPDQTFTTLTASGGVPTVANGTPLVAGQHAARIPLTIDPQGKEVAYRLLVSAGTPENGAGTSMGSLMNVIPAGSPSGGSIELVDLDPATTYHYRFSAQQLEGGNGTLGPEGTFTTPPYTAATSGQQPVHFKLQRKQIKLGRLTRHSRKLRIVVRSLPPETLVIVKLVAGRRHLKARKKAKAGNRVEFTIHFPGKFREALHNRRLKAVGIRFAASPPADATSRLNLRKKLRR
jgi:hypothetical protein